MVVNIIEQAEIAAMNQQREAVLAADRNEGGQRKAFFARLEVTIQPFLKRLRDETDILDKIGKFNEFLSQKGKNPRVSLLIETRREQFAWAPDRTRIKADWWKEDLNAQRLEEYGINPFDSLPSEIPPIQSLGLRVDWDAEAFLDVTLAKDPLSENYRIGLCSPYGEVQLSLSGARLRSEQIDQQFTAAFLGSQGLQEAV